MLPDTPKRAPGHLIAPVTADDVGLTFPDLVENLDLGPILMVPMTGGTDPAGVLTRSAGLRGSGGQLRCRTSRNSATPWSASEPSAP